MPIKQALQLKLSLPLTPVQQPLLALQFSNFSQILANLQSAPVVAVCIPHREIPDVDKLAAQFDPELRRVPDPGFEGIQDPDILAFILSAFKLFN